MCSLSSAYHLHCLSIIRQTILQLYVIYIPNLFSPFKLITLGRCVAYTGFLMTEHFLQEKPHFLLLFEQESTVHGVFGAVFFGS